MNFIYVPFSYLMKGCLWLSQNSYFFALFFFALAIELILLPLSIKQQKSQIKQAKVRPKEMAIREKYKGRTDKATQQKMTMEIQTMYQENGYNQFSGCLPLLIQLPIIFILFAIVRNPLTYASDIINDYSKNNAGASFLDDKANVIMEYYEAEKEMLFDEKFEDGEKEKLVSKIEEVQKLLATEVKENDTVVGYKAGQYADMYISTFIANGESDMESLISQGKLDPAIREKYEATDLAKYKDDIPNYMLFGIDLIDQPSLSNFSWLLLFPLLVFLSSFLSTKLMRKLQPAQLDANGNPVGGGLFMEVGMPLVSAVISFSFPAAIAAYWIWRTVIGIGKSLLLAKTFPIPQVTEEQIAEARKELKGKQKKKKVITIEVDEDDDSYNDIIVKGGKQSTVTCDPAKRTPRRIEMLTADDEPENKNINSLGDDNADNNTTNG